METILATLIFTAKLAVLALIVSAMIAGLVWLGRNRFRQSEQD